MPNIAIGSIIAKTLIAIAINIAVSYAFGPKPKAFSDSDRDLLNTNPSSIAPWRVVYGTTRVGGTVVFQHRANNKLYLVIVLAGHRVNDITEVWADDRPFRGSTTWDAGSAPGSEATWSFGTAPGTNHAIVRKYRGEQTTQYDTILETAAAKWDSTHLLLDRAYVVMELLDDTESWPNGLPNWSFVVEGKDDVYDPRDDSFKYTRNAALCQADYLFNDKFGVGAGAIAGGIYTKIDDADLIVAANICAESVALDAGGTEPRYECNGAFETDATHEEVIGHMLTASAGRIVFSEGTWHVHAGAHVAAAGDIEETDLVGAVQISPRLSRSELFNGVKGTYRGVTQDYLPTDYPPVTNSTYETQDGEQKLRDHDLAFTTSFAMAQRLAKIELEDSRQQISVTVRAKLKAYRYRPWDRVTLTLPRYGWAAKLFRVLDTRIVQTEGDDGPTLAVEMTLKETVSTIYDWSAEETAHDTAVDTDLLDLVTAMGAVQSLTIAKTVPRAGSSGIGEQWIRVDWDPPLDPGGLALYEIRWRHTGPPQSDDLVIYRVPKTITKKLIGPIASSTTAGTFQVEVYPVATNGVIGTQAKVTWTPVDLDDNYTGRVRSRTARMLRRRQEAAFQDQFDDELLNMDPDWDISRGTGTFTLNDGLAFGIDAFGGARMGFMTGSTDIHAFYDAQNGVPFDGEALYRISARMMRTEGAIGGQDVTLGVEGLNEFGTTMVNFQGANLSTGQYFVAADAFDMETIDVDVWHNVVGFIGGFKAAAADGDQGEHPDGNAPCEVHEDTRYIRPVVRYQPGTSGGRLLIDWIKIEALDADGARRVYSVLSNTFGRLRPGTRYERPADTAAIVRGMQTGLAQDGDTVTFSPAFDEVPEVSLLPQDVKTFENSWAASLDQKLILRTDDLTAAGFDLFAKVSQATAGITARTATLTETSPPIDVVDEVSHAIKTEALEAVDDIYEFQFDVYLDKAIELPGFPLPRVKEASVTFDFQARLTAGTWVTYGSKTYTNANTVAVKTLLNEIKTITVDGQVADSEFQIKITSVFEFIKLEGDQVSWNEATAPTNVTATPTADNKVRWIALEGS